MLQEAGEKVTRVDVGYDIGTAGLTVSLPIELNAPDGIRVGTTVNEVAFPTKWLQFEEVRGAPLVEAEVTANLKHDGENTDDAIVQIAVTGKQGMALPNGIIASVVFKISAEAKGPQALKLRNAARALSANAPPDPIEPVTGRDGEIELLDVPPAAVACFFYMH